MNKKIIANVLLGVVLATLSGCGSGEPDPRDHPDFNPETAANPGAVKMGATNVSGAAKPKK